MKKTFFLLLLPFAALAQKDKEFTLQGNLKLSKPIDWVYVTYRTAGNTVTDSFQTTGVFDYKGKLAEPVLATVRVKYKPTDSSTKATNEAVALYLEDKKMKFTAQDSLKNYTLSGSAAHQDYLQLTNMQKGYNESLNLLYQDWSRYGKEKDKEAQRRVETQVDSINNVIKEKVFLAFAKSHPQSPLALFAIKQYAGFDLDADKIEPLFNGLPAKVQKWQSAVEFKENIEIAKKTGIGKIAMDFTQNDTLDRPVSLSQFRGKYVLIDFWASWCGPCRVENPNVVKVFNQYKDKGFTVLGVSLDRPNAKDRWLKAIQNDSLTWTHVSDLKFWDNAVAKQYGIRAIPQNFLIDPQGKIIAKNLRGEDLAQKLETVMAAAPKTF